MRWACLFGLLLMHLHVPLTAWACRCVARHETFVEEVDRAGLILSGRVVARRVVGPEHHPRLRFELVPGTVWKGPVADRYFLYSEETSCKVDFSPGEEYLLMVRQKPRLQPDSLHLARCSDYYRLLRQAPELGIIKALFVPALRANMGTAGSRLNASEAEYFAGILPDAAFRFDNQPLGFIIDRQPISKQRYLSRFLTETMLKELLVFSPAEQAATGGYAAVLVAWPGRQGAKLNRLYRRHYKSGSMVSPAFRRRLVRRLARARPG